MRTSLSQFELLVSFMEKNGDLSKPTDGPHGRLTNIQRWAELVSLLNADATGDAKSEDKWRKTWSDLKNNTKRKAAKINRAASGTGGGPATKIKLTPIEERVIAIINPQAATGITEVPEVGLEQEVQLDTEVRETITSHITEGNENSLESWNVAGNSSQPSVFPSPPPQRRPMSQTVQERQSPPPATPPPITATRRRRRDERSSGPSPKRRRPAVASTQSELARQIFVNSDREWRTFNKEKIEKANELEKERLRLREIELQQQFRWQELFAQFLLVLEKAINHFS